MTDNMEVSINHYPRFVPDDSIRKTKRQECFPIADMGNDHGYDVLRIRRAIFKYSARALRGSGIHG